MPIELIAVALTMLLGCGVVDGATLVRRDDPADVRTACHLADERCTRCHSLDRVLALDPDGPADWVRYVRRMRLTPGSAISAIDERAIVACLQYRSFGVVAAGEVAP
ncbi:MAG: hypothetical protein IPL61_20285 [Myxococcales bacterium]|nr:hypothetical protein [Myxococcales bacterium]